jgi:hypothetical protein
LEWENVPDDIFNITPYYNIAEKKDFIFETGLYSDAYVLLGIKRFAVRRLPWRVWSLPAYDARCLLIGLELLSDRKIVAS